MTRRVRLKVCCISSVEEALLAAKHGAAAVGLVSAMPTGPGVIDEATIAEIAEAVPFGVSRFLLTSETSADAIVGQQRRTGVDTLQLVDDLDDEIEAWSHLRSELPGVRLVQVIHVESEASIARAIEAAPHVHMLLLDSGRPSQRELGGTGRIHDWEHSRRIVDAVDVPVLLAGGLNPANVADAVSSVRPWGVDVCSGLRSDGALDVSKLAGLVNALGVG